MLRRLLAHRPLRTQTTGSRLGMAHASVPAALAQRLQAKGQAHVLKFYEEGKLSDAQVDELVAQLEALDLDMLESIFQASTRVHGADGSRREAAAIEPVNDADQLEACSAEQRAQWQALGLEAVARGEVCALVLGGGQGTRLGFAGAKGMYNMGLPSGKTLFQLFAERVARVQTLARQHVASAAGDFRCEIPFYVMTSAMNHDATIAFFREHAFFGLSEQQVFFFPQGTMPCFTTDGKLMLESASRLATASDGNGGVYKALARSGALARLQRSGVKYLHAFSVDNVLCKAADPVFLGYCIDKRADCGNKVVWKSRPDESVGVVARKDGKFCIVEYSELDRAASELVDPATGRLAFGAANICNHFYTMDFLTDVVLPNSSLAFHVAKKKIPVADPVTGETVVPETNSGIKLEAFIFDVFPLSSRMAVLSVAREAEFAPVKNAPGSANDTPESARAMVYAEAKAWLAQATSTLGDTAKAEAFVAALARLEQVEVSPLVSYNGEALEGRVEALASTSPMASNAVLRLE